MEHEVLHLFPGTKRKTKTSSDRTKTSKDRPKAESRERDADGFSSPDSSVPPNRDALVITPFCNVRVIISLEKKILRISELNFHS